MIYPQSLTAFGQKESRNDHSITLSRGWFHEHGSFPQYRSHSLHKQKLPALPSALRQNGTAGNTYKVNSVCIDAVVFKPQFPKGRHKNQWQGQFSRLEWVVARGFCRRIPIMSIWNLVSFWLRHQLRYHKSFLSRKCYRQMASSNNTRRQLIILIKQFLFPAQDIPHWENDSNKTRFHSVLIP